MKTKSLKKIGVAFISAAMIMSMVTAVPAFAETTSGAQTKFTTKTVTMPSSNSTAKYTIYQIASAKFGDGQILEYTMKNFKGILEVDEVDGLIKLKDTDTAVHSLGAQATQNLAKTLDEAKDGATATATVNAGESVNLEPGYYLIVADSNEVSAPILLSVDNGSAKTLENKSSEITIDKTITAIDTVNAEDDLIASNQKTGIADKGAKVSYKLETQLPTYDTENVKAGETNITDFEILDLPEDTLSVDRDSIKVYIGGSDTNITSGFSVKDLTAAELAKYTGVEDANAKVISETAFKVVFDDDFVLNESNRGKSVVVTFDATVVNGKDGSVDINEDANDNTTVLSYSNNYNTGVGRVYTEIEEDPETGEEKEVEKEDPENPQTDSSKADVYCTIFTANKVDENGNALAGADFKLYAVDEDGNVSETAIEPVKEGSNVFKFVGLGAGTYKLVESKTPEGYKTADAQVFTVSTDKETKATGFTGKFSFSGEEVNSNTLNVKNFPGQLLPGTGGMGTVLFTVGGSAIVLMAGVLFVFYMKKRKVEE